MANALQYGLIAAAVSTGIILATTAISGSIEQERECSDTMRRDFKRAVANADHAIPLIIKSGMIHLKQDDDSTCFMRLNY